MKYKFYKKEIETTKTTYFLVDSEKEILKNFEFTKKNFKEIEIIIDGINTNKTKPKGDEYIWANEDLTVLCNQNGVFLLDMLAQRAKITEPEKLGLQLTHDEFLIFLNDFKKFVEENS